MSTDRTDPRWDEYLSTGIDPCENDIIDYEESRPRIHRKRNQTWQSSKRIIIINAIIFFLFAVFCIYAIFFSPSVVEERRKQKEIERQEEIKRQKRNEWIQAAIESSRSYSQSASRIDIFPFTEPTLTEAAPIEEPKYKGSLTSTKPKTTAPATTNKRTPYQQGYWDGYDEGYDDRIQGMGFGYKYDCDGEPYEYQKGYDVGYREGFSDAWEDDEAFGTDEW